ncbi:MAG: aconitate hydratase AcnA [bacterium]|nr:aconitate hydratase AcnA [bacterium]
MSFKTPGKAEARKTLKVGERSYQIYSLKSLEGQYGDLSKLPFSLKILLENLLRHFDGETVTDKDLDVLGRWVDNRPQNHEIAYRPARVLMQDFTGVPAVVDLAAMRDAVKGQGGDPRSINPLTPVDLVIDHSVMVDSYASPESFQANVKREYERNRERYAFLRWGQQAFEGFRVVPPGTGICHQVNLEYLSKVVWNSSNDQLREGDTLYPDTLVGTDSHTTMVNALGVLGWGVGGIEAEAAMLGQPISMLIPDVVGVELTGRLPEGTTATDLVLAITNMLRLHGVVGKFVEFFGTGVSQLSLADRSTIANMAPEYGATCGLFPVDTETLRYLRFSGRAEEQVQVVEAYAKEQGLWYDPAQGHPTFTETLSLDLVSIEPSIAGPKRPQDKVPLSQAVVSVSQSLIHEGIADRDVKSECEVKGQQVSLTDGDIMIAAITSCTNTSNPSVMIGAGLVAKKAVEKGLDVKPWVKTSLAPGSQVVTDYLEKADLMTPLQSLGFHLVGYGCTTCIGNSGPLDPAVDAAILKEDLTVAAVLSGNRNFEGRIHPRVKLNYLASPPLVVAYALAGSMKVDLLHDSLGKDSSGNPVYLKDIWPTNKEIQDVLEVSMTPEMFTNRYGNVFEGDDLWKSMPSSSSLTYDWQPKSTYVKNPPFFDKDQTTSQGDIEGASILALLGDSVTTDHISPAGAIKPDSPAGLYLQDEGVTIADFNSYGARRGNHEVMMRGTFANIRLRNEMVPDSTGGITKYIPSGETMSIYDAAMKYQTEGTSLVVIGGAEYGTGSSRDWAAKGTRLLGVKAVITESFERIHRSNLIGMGVLPLVFEGGVTRKTLSLKGDETISILGLSSKTLAPRQRVRLQITYPDGAVQETALTVRLDTPAEVDYYLCGGILHRVLQGIAKKAA